MVGPAAKRDAVAHLKAVMGLSERRACQIISADRKTIRYQSNRPPETELRAKLRELANERRRFGYRRLFVLLRREGEPSGVNRIYRLYREEGLSVRKRKARRRAVGTRAPILVEAKANARWSLDFVHDQFACGRRFRVLNIVDDVTRECLAAIPDTSISGRRVARELTTLIERRGKPGMIVSDNGTELTSNAILAWSKDHKVEWHYIAPGKPMQNGYVESFMYRRPRGRKRLSANFRSSYACVHVFGLCLRPRQWSPALMEYADRGLINGSRLNAAPKALRVYSILSSAG
jgi:transposase InsO family protein